LDLLPIRVFTDDAMSLLPLGRSFKQRMYGAFSTLGEMLEAGGLSTIEDATQ
jgi:hypothetical protein